MSEHTPAPWHIGVHEDTNELGIVGPNYGIAAIFCQRGLTVPIPVAEAMANARLMSAAPDLLAFAEAFMDLFLNADMRPEDECHGLMSQAVSAIAKATGEGANPQ